MSEKRFIIVAFEEKDRFDTQGRVRRSNMAKLRRMLHEMSREHSIKLTSFGTNFDAVTNEEREQIETIFNNVLERSKARDAEIISILKGDED